MTERVDAPITETKAPEGHDERMAALYENPDGAIAPADGGVTRENAAPETPGERPAWLPEKFKSPEDMAKAYAELERKQSAAPEKPAAEGEQAEKPEAGTEGQAVAQAALSNAGLNMADFEKEYAEKGELSASTYETLEKAGFPREVADRYIAGQKAVADQHIVAATADVEGGREAFENQVVPWAASNMTEKELAGYNAMIDKARETNNTDLAKLAVQTVYAKYVAANGEQPNLVNVSGASPSSDVFGSSEQLMDAMADPRYKADPAYRKSVEEKLSRSDIL